MIFTIHDPVYVHDILVAVDEPDARVYRTLERLTGEKLDDEDREILKVPGRARTVIFPGGVRVMRLPKYKNSPGWHSVLAHEAYHAATFLMGKVGIKRGDESDEAVAYEVQFMVHAVLSRVMGKR
jgi:hypothetical protein